MLKRCLRNERTLRDRLIRLLESEASVESWLSADPAVLRGVAATHFSVAATYVHVLLTTAASHLASESTVGDDDDDDDGRRICILDLDAVASRFRLFRTEGSAIVRSFCDKALEKWSASSGTSGTEAKKRRAFAHFVRRGRPRDGDGGARVRVAN